MSRSSYAALLLPAVLVLAGCAPSSGEKADLILHNATIWTVDETAPTAQAVAIRDGRFVTPGFIDTHVHFASAARFLEFNIMWTETQEVFVERVEDVRLKSSCQPIPPLQPPPAAAARSSFL